MDPLLCCLQCDDSKSDIFEEEMMPMENFLRTFMPSSSENENTCGENKSRDTLGDNKKQR